MATNSETQHHIHLLIVEDDADILQLLSEILRGTFPQITILTAGDGMTAKLLIEEQRVDIILSDINMPHMSGIELLGWLKEKELQHILTIMLTGVATVEHAVKALQRGCFDFLVKPVDPQELEAAITHAAQEVVQRSQRNVTVEELELSSLPALLAENEEHIKNVAEQAFMRTSVGCLCRNLAKLQDIFNQLQILTNNMLLSTYRMRLKPDHVQADDLQVLRDGHSKIALLLDTAASCRET